MGFELKKHKKANLGPKSRACLFKNQRHSFTAAFPFTHQPSNFRLRATQCPTLPCASTFGAWRDRFPWTDDINQLQQAFAAKLARLESDGLKLNIGIMGRVKAGKAAF